jgi:FAD/FMN-containing dehydrogenase
LSLEHGFGSDNVVAYEVVLADGSIRVATPHSHRDLYWALKYGSTNFGIVTRFDMSTFPVDQIWGGAFFYTISHARPLLESLVNFTAALADDPKGMSAFGLLWNSDAQDYIIWAPSVYLKPIAFPPLFSALAELDVEPLSSTMRMASHAEITDEVNDLFGGGVRARWFTMTLRPNVQILLDIHERGAAAFEPDRQRSGFISGFTAQPINVGLVAAGSKNGGNPIGLSTDDGDLIREFYLNIHRKA